MTTHSAQTTQATDSAPGAGAAGAPAPTPHVVPMLSYEDVPGMLDWLVRAFGFAERLRLRDEAGAVVHAELGHGNGAVMLGNPGPAYRSPRRHRESCPQAAEWLRLPYVVDGVHVWVADADADCARARAAGAVILSEPEDAPHARLYRAEDPEGHRWMFAQPRLPAAAPPSPE